MDGSSSRTSDIELVSYKDPELFRRVCFPWLLEEEDLNNALIGMVDLIADGSSVYSKPYFLATLTKDSKLVGCCAYANPDGLLVSAMSEPAAHCVLERFDSRIGIPRRIVGPPAIARLMSTNWREKEPVRQTLQTVWNIWRIDAIPTHSIQSAGELRLGSSSDEELVADWGRSYGEEKPHAPINVRSFMLRKLRRRELFIWEDSGPTTILTLSGATKNGVKISAVFTPVEKRGAGHATNAVAKLVEHQILTGRKFLTLVTEDGEHHVDRMYQKLGFRRIGTRHCYTLEPLA